jgi:hypothetical protein
VSNERTRKDSNNTKVDINCLTNLRHQPTAAASTMLHNIKALLILLGFKVSSQLQAVLVVLELIPELAKIITDSMLLSRMCINKGSKLKFRIQMTTTSLRDVVTIINVSSVKNTQFTLKTTNTVKIQLVLVTEALLI